MGLMDRHTLANQAFEFDAVQRDDFDGMTYLAVLQGTFNLFERISVSKKKRSLFRCELDVDRFSSHNEQPLSLAMRSTP